MTGKIFISLFIFAVHSLRGILDSILTHYPNLDKSFVAKAHEAIDAADDVAQELKNIGLITESTPTTGAPDQPTQSATGPDNWQGEQPVQAS
jgi:hypothetical protein